MSTPPVLINGQWIPAEQFFGQTLQMTVPATVYLYPDTGAPSLGTVPPGQPIGQVFSYVQNSQGFWWQLDSGGFVLYSPSTITPPPLGQYGAGTSPAPVDTGGDWLSSLLDNLASGFGAGIPTAVVIGAVALGAYLLFRGGDRTVVLDRR